MSNRQLGWDDQRVRDRLSPRELNEQDKQAMEQQEANQEQESADKVIDSNHDSFSHKKD